ncbi:MAG: recombinase family protein [Lachnospiraceae bacterium]
MQWHMPIGYKVIDGKITVCEENRKIVEEIFEDYDSGISATRIAKGLKARGIKNAQDRVAWTHVSIGRILENHNYLGTEYYPQIIETELFERVQKRREQIRADGGKGSHRPGRDVRILFGGVITCAECGAVYSHIQPHDKKRASGIPKWKCKNYVYQNRLTCAGGFISDEQVKDVCVNAINRIMQDRKLMNPPERYGERVSAEYRKLDCRITEAKEAQLQRTSHADLMELLYERAAERYRTLEIRDTDYKIEEMREILADREELVEFDEELYRKLITQIVVYKDQTAEVIFINGSRIKTGYADK